MNNKTQLLLDQTRELLTIFASQSHEREGLMKAFVGRCGDVVELVLGPCAFEPPDSVDYSVADWEELWERVEALGKKLPEVLRVKYHDESTRMRTSVEAFRVGNAKVNQTATDAKNFLGYLESLVRGVRTTDGLST